MGRSTKKRSTSYHGYHGKPGDSAAKLRTTPHLVKPHQSLVAYAPLVLYIAIVAGAVAITQWPALSARAFSFDDDQYLKSNPLVQNPSWLAAQRFLTEVLEPSTVGGYYQPLAMISLMLDHAGGGSVKNLRPFHRTSLALHVCNTALVIVLLHMLFGRPELAAMVGLLFGLHPMTVETIAWVGERKTVLAAFFALLCLICHVRYARTAHWKYYVLCAAMYVLALMSKPTSTPLPLVMLLLDWWPLRRFSRRAVLEKLPLLAIAGLSSIITVISQEQTAAVVMPGERSPARIVFSLCHNVIFYLYKIIWPVDLSSHYAFPNPMSLAHPRILAGVVGTCLLIPSLLFSLRWTRVLLTGWLIFFVTIFPTMGVIGFTTVIASDKFAYLPSFGLMLILMWSLTHIWPSACSHARLKVRALATAAIVLCLATAEAVTTRNYLAVWQDSLSLHKHMASLTPNSAFVHNSLGFALEELGQIGEAAKQYEIAVQIDPNSYTAHNNLGNILLGQKKMDQAIAHFTKALDLYPAYDHARFNLATALYEAGRADESLKNYALLLERNPDYYKAYNNRGCILLNLSKYDEALKDFTAAARLYPDYADAHANIGIILNHKGQLDKAIDCYHETLRIDPRSLTGHYNLADTLLAKGRLDEAIEHYRIALQIKPDLAVAHANLGSALARKGNLTDAVQAYRAALAIQPASSNWHCALADLLSQQNQINEAISEYQKALQIDPNNAKATEGLASVMAGKKQ